MLKKKKTISLGPSPNIQTADQPESQSKLFYCSIQVHVKVYPSCEEFRSYSKEDVLAYLLKKKFAQAVITVGDMPVNVAANVSGL